VVHVSSIAAVFTPQARVLHVDLPPALDATNVYTRSKALAEDVVRRQQDAGAPVTIVYPGGISGPAAGDAFGEVSAGFESMLRSGMVALRDGGVNVIDVRDVADILVATVHPGAGPRRFMAGGQLVTLPEIGHILRRLTGRRMPVMPAPGVVFRTLGRGLDVVRKVVPFDTVFTGEAMDALTLVRPTDDRAVHDELGIAYRDPVDTIEAMVRSLYAAGRVSARQVGSVAARATA
jgi:nucleoside-diphosphate-sugar epimerase